MRRGRGELLDVVVEREVCISLQTEDAGVVVPVDGAQVEGLGHREAGEELLDLTTKGGAQLVLADGSLGRKGVMTS